MNNMLLRALSGSVYVGLIIASLWFSSSSLYLIVFGFLIFMGIWEYEDILEVNRTRPLRRLLDAGMGVYLFWAVYRIAFGGLATPVATYFIPYILYLFYILIRAIYSDRHLMPAELSKAVFGQFYIAGSLSTMSMLGGGDGGRMVLPLLLFACIWTNDTFAYLTGMTFGKRPLFPSVSPKKSWEGFFGGLIASVLVGYLLATYVFKLDSVGVPALLWGLVASVASTWGDLFESMLKRNAGVKDSGHIIPGHGGVLDRVDSALFVMPMGYVLYLIFNTCCLC